jgi:hypothetical protein
VTRRYKWMAGLFAASVLCLSAGFGPLTWHDDRTDTAYLEWRERPTPERQAAWVAAEAEASRREQAIRETLVQAGAALALAGGLVWWTSERRGVKGRPGRP